jgi:hypothetical protein
VVLAAADVESGDASDAETARGREIESEIRKLFDDFFDDVPDDQEIHVAHAKVVKLVSSKASSKASSEASSKARREIQQRDPQAFRISLLVFPYFFFFQIRA